MRRSIRKLWKNFKPLILLLKGNRVKPMCDMVVIGSRLGSFVAAYKISKTCIDGLFAFLLG
jgi:hypothetical protein